MWQDGLLHCIVFTKTSEELAPHYLAGIRHDMRQTTIPMVSPKAIEKYGEDWKRHPVGTGPFMLKEWLPGEHVLLVKNPHYFKRMIRLKARVRSGTVFQ